MTRLTLCSFVGTFVGAPALLSCGTMENLSTKNAPKMQEKSVDEPAMDAPGSAAPAPARSAPTKPMGESAAASPAPNEADLDGGYGAGEAEAKGEADKEESPADGLLATGAGPEQAAVRAWFPESFLWVPIVETDSTGTSTLPFTVPDTLTTWRILALGQTRQGSQGGTTHTFLSTLPAYVDVAAPLKLRVGDVVDLPLQVVNQAAVPLRGVLAVKVSGGLGQGGGAVNVAAWGSTPSTVRTVANHAGTLVVEAALSGGGEAIDTVRKSVSVTPVGRPVTQSRAGSLAGPRTVTFDAVGNSLDGNIAITVFPGALSVVRSEIALAGGRGGDVGSAAYAFRVSQSAAPLIADKQVDAGAARDLGLVALQRLMRVTRSAGTDPAGASVAALALAGLGHPDGDGLDAHLAGRMRDLVTQAQQPDGLWSSESGHGLDDQLIVSARHLWALRQSEAGGPGSTGKESSGVKGARLRFSGALERFADRLTDPYVAAWALASGGADGLYGEQRAKLLKTVEDALIRNADGSLKLDPTLGVSSMRVLGSSTAEATAVALLAVQGGGAPDAETVTRIADLATGVLGRWSPGAGFGGGWAGLTALPALAGAMGGEIPDHVTLQLYADDKPVGQGALDPKQKHAPVLLSVPGAAHTLRLEANPAVPGLAFTAVATSWVPWVAQSPHGLDLRVTPPASPRVGVRDTLQLDISGPTGATADVDLSLPAGVDMGDVTTLTAALARAGTGSATTEEGALHLRGVTLQNGLWSAALPVTMTLAGSLQAGASIVTLTDGESYSAVPSTWVVR